MELAKLGYTEPDNKYGDVGIIGRVAAQYKNDYKVFIEEGSVITRISGKMIHGKVYPVVGDWVILDRENKLIIDILERKIKFSRKTAGSETVEQVLVSNVDYIFIVSSLNREFNISRLERYMTMVYESGASPVFILTKSDIGEDVESKVLDLEGIAFGIPIHVISTVKKKGLGELKKYFSGNKTVALVGSSGVGKSTLINVLVGKEVMETGEIRRKSQKGKHVTSRKEMFFLEEGIIIDTPGMRELQLWEADLEESFQDIMEFAGFCRFKDCSHEIEPGCAVQKAMEEGKLKRKRVENYLKMRKEMEYIEKRKNLKPSQVEKEKIKKMMGSLKARKQIKNK